MSLAHKTTSYWDKIKATAMANPLTISWFRTVSNTMCLSNHLRKHLANTFSVAYQPNTEWSDHIIAKPKI